jgi:hypothetical protein
VRHQGQLNKPVESGGTQREHWESAAKRGSEAARAALDGPECPESLAYLLSWARALHARSGIGMNGFAPLSWTTLDAWARWTGNVPDREDVDALFVIDSVMLFPDPPKEAE